MRPTTKDLAKAAGVSLATVDRVLNERPGVKGHTVRKVNDAIARIGFVRNLSAANLARQRDYQFVFVLPASGDEFLQEVRARITEAQAAFASDMVNIRLQDLQTNDPHKVAGFLSGLDSADVDGVALMAPESPQVRDAALRLEQRGIHVLPFISGQHHADTHDFVGIDNRAAGATAGHLMGRFVGAHHGTILVVAETMQARDSLERRRGFDEVLTADFPQVTVLPSLETHGDGDRTRRIIASAFANHPDIVGVYLMASEAHAPLDALPPAPAATKPVVIAHERTAFTENGLKQGRIDAVIAQNPGHLVRSAIRILRARSDNRKPLASQERIRIEVLLKENL